MKILIAYYSKSRSTHNVAMLIQKNLAKNPENTIMIEQVQADPERTVWQWFVYRLFHRTSSIKTPQIQDVSDFDVIFFGSPNWTRLACPMATYIDQLKGLKHKRVATFGTTAWRPDFEWYLFSTFLFDLSFSNTINFQNARLVNNLLLSSVYQPLSANTPRGQHLIQDFCRSTLNTDITSKSYYLNQLEIQNTRLFSTILSFISILTTPFALYLLFTTGLHIFHLYFLATILSAIFLMIILSKPQIIKLGKYTVSTFFILLYTLLQFHFQLHFSIYAIFTIVGFFVILGTYKCYRIIIYAGTLNILISFSQFVLFSNFTNLFQFLEQTLLISFSAILIATLMHKQRSDITSLLDTQDALEKSDSQLKNNIHQIQKLWHTTNLEKLKSQAIISNLTDGLVVIDTKNSTIQANQKAQQLLLPGSSNISLETLHSLHDSQTQQSLYTLFTHGTKIQEIILPNGTQIILSTTKLFEKNLNSMLHICLMHDTTQERQLEKMKLDFASIAAHELRTPLTVMKGASSILNDNYHEMTETEIQEYIHKIHTSSHRLGSLVDSILAVTRVEKGHVLLNLEKVDVNNIILESIADLSQDSAQKDQTVTYQPNPDLPQIHADYLKTKEILINLLSNAIRYTDHQGLIEITTQVKDHDLHIHVKDNGQGIPDSLKSVLFNKFTRAENSLRKETKGVGLGLYLVKSLTELQGGRLYFQSQENIGSTFSVTIPIYE
jgi:signal transduction histidine kinase/flavodoxin